MKAISATYPLVLLVIGFPVIVPIKPGAEAACNDALVHTGASPSIARLYQLEGVPWSGVHVKNPSQDVAQTRSRAAQPNSRALARRTLASLHPRVAETKIRDVLMYVPLLSSLHPHLILHSVATIKPAGSSYTATLTSDSFPLKCAIRGAPQCNPATAILVVPK